MVSNSLTTTVFTQVSPLGIKNIQGKNMQRFPLYFMSMT